MMMEDDEFSSDSDASSVDISLLVADSLKPLKMAPVADFTHSDEELPRVSAEKAAAPSPSNTTTEMNASRQETKNIRDGTTISDEDEKHEDEARSAAESPTAAVAIPAIREASATREHLDRNKTIAPQRGKRIKIVMGESVFNWQRARRNQSTLASLPDENVSKFVTIRDTPATAAGLLHGAKITVTPPTVQVTSQENKEYTGKYASQSLSSPLVECVAIYDEERKCHVLEVVDWTVSNLKPRNTEPSRTPATHPREQSRQAEERVRKKQTDASRKKSPNEKKKRSKPTSSSNDDKATPKDDSSKNDELPKIKYRGVTPIKRQKGIRYRAQISLEGKAKYLGTFATAEEAARRYDEEARAKATNHCLNFQDSASPKDVN